MQNNQMPIVSMGMPDSDDASKPLITTIIPTYRRPELLRRAIESVLSQTYPHFQVRIYDNASGDETAEVVAEYAKKDPRVKYHCHAENIGGLKNYNYGLEHVDTPFFSLLSDDDLVLPDFYEITLRGFKDFPDALFSAGTTINMTEEGHVLSASLASWEREGYFAPPDGLLQMLERGVPTWTSVLFRKEAIEKVGTLDADVGPPADYDFELRIAARFPIVITNKPCGIWVARPSSHTATSMGFDFFWPGWLKMIRNLTEDERIPFELRIRVECVLREELSRILFRIGVESIKRKNFGETYSTAGVLRSYFRLRWRALLLVIMGRAFEYLPPIYYLARFILSCRKLLRTIYRRFRDRWWMKEVGDAGNLQKQFGHYAKLL
ncbi:MAG: glycosyltransferase family 2 protein [Actinobacteria bacterium]|nr:glycosyltransferase family 2 protein [Actinomycetota bacterium]